MGSLQSKNGNLPTKRNEETRLKKENDYTSKSLPEAANRRMVVALYNYDARQPDDLSFKKGDKMEILDSSGDDWLKARNVKTLQVGLVPRNYITEDANTVEKQDWWFGGDRRDADKQLMLPGNPKGTFLIRHSGDKRSCALSIRDFNDATREVSIRHYRVKVDDSSKFYIAVSKTFPSLLDLVNHYGKHADGLCSRLTKPCPKEPQCVPFRELEVNRNELQLLTKLGQGQFGEVWKGKWRKQIDVAVKTLKIGSMSVEEFIEEAKKMHTLRHQRLVQIMGVCTDQSPVYIVTELMAKGCLLEYLRADDGRTIKLANMIDMANDITEGLAYLEKRRVIHRDIRAANILVGANLSCKVADFGLAKITDDDGVYTVSENAKFPIKWTSPEAAYKKKFSSKSDVWSFGILMHEIVTYGRTPYPGMDNMTTLEKVHRGYRMPRATNCGYNASFDCPQPIYSIMTNCWDFNPERRPTFEYLGNFFNSYSVETERQYCER